jgi:biopolymer transport protein ExbD
MAEKRRELDVWIVQSNTVYRKVPYTVVTDWIQEGRLLGEDRVRAAGGEKWHRIGDVPALAAFLPRAEPFPIEDRAEALEPVEAGFDWKKGGGADEEDDVDMIPLIDVSLVLLIFFMMTAAVGAGLFSAIETPRARHQLAKLDEGMFWIGMDRKGPDGTVEKGPDGQPLPWYSLGKGEDHLELRPEQATKAERYVTQDLAHVTAKLARQVGDEQGKVPIRLRADRTLMWEAVRATTLGLQQLEERINRERGASRGRVTFEILGEVSEPQGQ